MADDLADIIDKAREYIGRGVLFFKADPRYQGHIEEASTYFWHNDKRYELVRITDNSYGEWRPEHVKYYVVIGTKLISINKSITN